MGDATFWALVALIIFLAVVVAAMVFCTFGGLYRSAKDKRWGWFWAIICTWIAGLGWLFGGIYLIVGKRKSPRTITFSKDKRAAPRRPPLVRDSAGGGRNGLEHGR